MNILTDVMSLLKRNKYIEIAKPEDVLVLGIHEEPDILGIASPIPYKDVKLIKVKDLTSSGDCSHVNIPEIATTIAGVYKDTTTVDGECYINLRRLKSLSTNLTIAENGDYIDFTTLGEPNTGLNLGSGAQVWKDKLGEVLRFRTITSTDTSVTITQLADTIDLSVAGLGNLVNINVLTVTKSGNDTTAAILKYDFHDPWKNPTVAMTAAVSGDVVVVYPGTYTIGVGADVTDNGSQWMVKDGVTLYMMPGAIIQYTTNTGTIGTDLSLPFTDGGLAHTFIIRGKGQFIFAADTTDATVPDYFNLTGNVGTTVDWEFDKITIKRRFGGPYSELPKFSSWRMVGREYINTESGIFQFELPPESTNISIDIDIEEVTITYTNGAKAVWTVNKLFNLSTGSIVNIRYGKVSYPNAISAGGFHENDTCDKLSVINLTIDNITRTGTDSYTDFFVYHNTDTSKGTYTIKNINTKKGLIKSDSATGVEACRTAYLHGNVYTNGGGVGNYMMHFDTTNVHYKIELDIVHNGTSEYDLGIYAKDSWQVKISGYLKWANTLSEPIHLDYGSTVKSLTVWNLMLSEVASTYSVANINATTGVNLHVMNTFASKAIRPAGGVFSAITEDIGTIIVDPVV
jgi:hypothetical protein